MKQNQASELRARTPEGRILSLDALRGVAAVVVVLHHFRLCFLLSEPRWFLRPLFAGAAAVTVFFVLSGYVLALPVWRGRQPGYGRYLTRRICRIYLPYLAAAVLAILVGSHLLFSHTGLTSWFDRTWQKPMTLGFDIRQMIEVPGDGALNTAFWSLRYEFEMSLIFPLICMLLARLRWRASFVTVILCFAGVRVLEHFLQRPIWKYGVLPTCWYGLCFVLGAIMSRNRDGIGALYRRTSSWIKWAVLTPFLLLLFVAQNTLMPWSAAALLLVAEFSSARRWLETRIPEYLGRVSYSMYLVHGTVLWTVMILLEHRVPLPALVLIYLAAVWICSDVFCRLVEEPTIRLGKRLTVRGGLTSDVGRM
jgi:peptidoglycan/LPS O-acetylase OafA/YrhL